MSNGKIQIKSSSKAPSAWPVTKGTVAHSRTVAGRYMFNQADCSLAALLWEGQAVPHDTVLEPRYISVGVQCKSFGSHGDAGFVFRPSRRTKLLEFAIQLHVACLRPAVCHYTRIFRAYALRAPICTAQCAPVASYC
jgi:hypothetical protein